MEKSIFEVGKTYSIHTKSGQRYDDATVTDVDNIFISFIYNNEGLIRSNILNMDIIASAFEEASSSARKKIWYAGTFDSDYYNSPRWGIRYAVLSPEDIELTKTAGTKVFTTEEAAKKYFFTQIKMVTTTAMLLCKPKQGRTPEKIHNRMLKTVWRMFKTPLFAGKVPREGRCIKGRKTA